jgi:RNA polymerase sigma-70 factor (ECF subfamily)
MNYNLLEDEILMKLLKAGDETALKEIYLRYWKGLYIAALKKVHSKEAAEEIVQNVIVGLWNKRVTSDVHHLQNYLNTAVKYQVINYVKAKILHEKKLQLAISKQPSAEDTCEDALLLNELSAAIDQAVKLLPEKTQLVFKLNRFENHSVREISQHMNISEKAVEYHITKSLKTIRVHLKEFVLLLALFILR